MSELWAELERAAADYAEIPEHLRPVVTVVRCEAPDAACYHPSACGCRA